MKSVLWASSQPPPYAMPLTAAKIGLRSWRHRVERAVEGLALAQPVLLGHGLALPQVAPDGEGPVSGSREDDDPDRRTDRDLLDDLGQQGAHLGGDRVVGMGPVEGDPGDAPVGEVVQEDGWLGLLDVGGRRAEVERCPAVGA